MSAHLLRYLLLTGALACYLVALILDRPRWIAAGLACMTVAQLL